jgi:hypothetical protein
MLTGRDKIGARVTYKVYHVYVKIKPFFKPFLRSKMSQIEKFPMYDLLKITVSTILLR